MKADESRDVETHRSALALPKVGELAERLIREQPLNPFEQVKFRVLPRKENEPRESIVGV
jgi:hypothetical protein